MWLRDWRNLGLRTGRTWWLYRMLRDNPNTNPDLTIDLWNPRSWIFCRRVLVIFRASNVSAVLHTEDTRTPFTLSFHNIVPTLTATWPHCSSAMKKISPQIDQEMRTLFKVVSKHSHICGYFPPQKMQLRGENVQELRMQRGETCDKIHGRVQTEAIESQGCQGTDPTPWRLGPWSSS